MSWCANVGRGESWAGGKENKEKGTVKLSRYCPGLGSCLGILAGLAAPSAVVKLVLTAAALAAQKLQNLVMMLSGRYHTFL